MNTDDGEIIELAINGIGSDSAGVGRAAGLAVFVPGALPGERVRAVITARKKRYALARLSEVVTPSPYRVAPACPVYGSCGGCAWQHSTYEYERKLKGEIVAQTLRRIGGIDIEVPPPLPAIRPLAYRNRVVLHVEAGKGLRIGFYGGKSHQLCPYGGCQLLMPPLRELQAQMTALLPDYAAAFAGLRALALRCNSGGDALLLTLVAGEPLPADAVSAFARELIAQEPRLISVWQNSGAPVYGVYGAEWRHAAGEEKLPERLDGLELKLAPGSFFQVNPAEMLRLYRLVEQALAMDGGLLLDLYSGVGSIALYLARAADQVIGVEQYAPAVADAEENARRNGIANCRFIAAAAEDALPALAGQGVHPIAAVLDPPRAGCEPAVLQALLDLRPESIAYVSCDPATLARDLRILLAGDGYRLRTAQPVDMFPRTGHVETVVLMSRVQD